MRQISLVKEIVSLSICSVIYTSLGCLWAIAGILALEPGYRSLALLGVATVGLLLLAYVVELIQSTRAMWKSTKKKAGVFPRQEFRKLFWILSADALVIGLSAVILSVIDRTNWIFTAATILFALHFFFLPAELALQSDYFLAGGMAILTALGPLVMPNDPHLWAALAGLSGLLFSWLAAAIRIKRSDDLLRMIQGGMHDATHG